MVREPDATMQPAPQDNQLMSSIRGKSSSSGLRLAQWSVAKYMVKRTRPPSQGWRTFLRNHAPDIAAMELFVGPDPLAAGALLYKLSSRSVIEQRARLGSTSHPDPTTEWIARRSPSFSSDRAAGYVFWLHHDAVPIALRRAHAVGAAMGIRDRPTAPASPWQNGFAEQLIGSIRRECVDHIIVLGEPASARILRTYAGLLQRRQNS